MTERRRAEEALRASEARMRLMADSLPVLISYIDRDERYRFVNAGYRESFGIEPEQLLGRPVREFLGEAVYRRVRGYVHRALAAERLRFDGELDYATGRRHVSITYAPHFDDRGGVLGFYALISDVSDLKRSEREARDAESRIRAVLDAALDGIITIDASGTVDSVNPAACEMFGYRTEELVGCNVNLLMPGSHAEPRESYRAPCRCRGERRIVCEGRELVGRRRDGSTFPLHLVVSEARSGNGRRFVGLIRDLSEQKALEDELRAAASAAALAEERERRRLATDLHDDVGQILSLAGMKLGMLRGVAASEELGSRVRAIEHLVAQAQNQIGSLTFQLSPPVLHDVGLASAVEWLGDDMAQRYGLKVEVQDDDRPKPLPEARRVTLYRAVRELLINVARHAGTSAARVRLQREGGVLTVSVEDRGIGFDPSAERAGFGLVSIRERLRHLGGSMELSAVPGEGTAVTLQAPIEDVPEDFAI